MDIKQKTVTIDGTDYTLQKIPPRQWLRLRQRTKDKNGNPIDENLYDEILEHIVVAPKMKIDDFEELETLEEVVKAAITFQCKREEKEQ